MTDSSSVTDNIVEITEEETKETEADNKMPSLVNKKYEDIKENFEKKYNVTLEATYEENADYPKEIIFWQEIEIGQPIKEGMTIKVKVSSGKTRAYVPEFENWKLDDYIKLVEERGIEYTKVSEINFDYENGYVIRVSPDPGSEIDLDSDEVLTIYYADNPEETTEEPTEAPTEEPTEEPTEALADNPEEPVNNDSQAVVE